MNPTLEQMTGPQQIDYVLGKLIPIAEAIANALANDPKSKQLLDEYEVNFTSSVAQRWKVRHDLTDKQVGFLETTWFKITHEVIHLTLNDATKNGGNGRQAHQNTQETFNYRPPGPPKPPPVTAQDFAQPKSSFSNLQQAYGLALSLSKKLNELIHDRTTKPNDVKNYVHLSQTLNHAFHFHD